MAMENSAEGQVTPSSSNCPEKSRASVPWHKDFKIQGSVSDGGLSFVSLSRQIDAGVGKGYTDHDVIEGVLRAIAPGVKLRSYLEGRKDLTLHILRQILRTYYKEPAATEQYKELCNLTQGANEDPADFLMRALDLKQKVLGAADNEADVPYDENIVNSMFLHALSTGLRDDSIRHQLRGVLVKGVTDVEILQSLDRIALTENEHNEKVHTKLKVHSIEMPRDPQIEQLRGEIDALKEQLAKIAPPTQEPVASRPREAFRPPRRNGGNFPKKCATCRDANRWCNHCFKCGSGENFQRDCREALNGQRSLGTGKQ